MDSQKLFELSYGDFIKAIENLSDEEKESALCYAHGWIASALWESKHKE